MAKIETIIKDIEGLTVVELAELVKTLETKFGVSAVAAVAPSAGAPAAGPAKPAEEQTVFNVVLKSDNGKKIQVLKVARELIPTLTLLDAKKMVESLPKDIVTGVNKQTAEEAKKKLEAAGATVELK